MNIILPFDKCPSCQSHSFKVNAQVNQLIEIIVTDNEIDKTKELKKPKLQKSSLRKSWFCANCNKHVFDTKDITLKDSVNDN